MNDTKQRLENALLILGKIKLAEIWDVSSEEAGRRLNGQRNIPFDDFCVAIDALGIRLVPPDDSIVLIDSQELHALRILARKSLEQEGERREKSDRRKV